MISPYIYPGLDSVEISTNKIINIVCKRFGLNYEDIFRPTNKRLIVLPRQICIYLVRQHLKWTYHEIGAFFYKDHATAIHSTNTVAHLKLYDAEMIEMITEIETYLRVEGYAKV